MPSKSKTGKTRTPAFNAAQYERLTRVFATVRGTCFAGRVLRANGKRNGDDTTFVVVPVRPDCVSPRGN